MCAVFTVLLLFSQSFFPRGGGALKQRVRTGKETARQNKDEWELLCIPFVIAPPHPPSPVLAPMDVASVQTLPAFLCTHCLRHLRVSSMRCKIDTN